MSRNESQREHAWSGEQIRAELLEVKEQLAELRQLVEDLGRRVAFLERLQNIKPKGAA